MGALIEELGEPEITSIGDGVLEARVALAVNTESGTPLRRALRSAAAGRVEAKPGSSNA
jgi:hypothetical protein